MNTPEEKRPNRHIAVRTGLAFAVGVTGTAGAVLAGKAILDRVSQSPVAASEQQNTGVMPTQEAYNQALRTLTPTEQANTVQAIVATRTATPTAEPSPTLAATNTPEATATSTATVAPATATATATETPKPVETSPLPEYGVFMGDLLSKEETKTGAITIIKVAEKPQLVVYWAKERDNKGVVPDRVYFVNLGDIKGNDFEAANPAVGRKLRPGIYTMLGSFDSSNNRLNGMITETGAGGGIVEVLRFETTLGGKGKDDAIVAIKKTKLSSYRNSSLQDIDIKDILADLKNLNVELP